MTKLSDLNNWFTYHPPNKIDLTSYDKIRREARGFAQILLEEVPEGIELDAALLALRQVVMLAITGIDCYEPEETNNV